MKISVRIRNNKTSEAQGRKHFNKLYTKDSIIKTPNISSCLGNLKERKLENNPNLIKDKIITILDRIILNKSIIKSILRLIIFAAHNSFIIISLFTIKVLTNFAKFLFLKV